MTITINTRKQSFYFDIFIRIARHHPQHIFIFILDELNDPSFLFPENVIPIVLKKAKISLLPRVVKEQRISFLLKKYKAAVCVSEKYLLPSKVPQCLIVKKDHKIRSLQKAKIIVTDSQFFKKEIIEKYKIDENKIEVVYKNADEDFRPIAFDKREKIKEKYSGGNEFFLTTEKISIKNLFNLLKAFSIFKKRQKSNMRLLMASTGALPHEFIEQLRLYKFKSEVIFFENITRSEAIKIKASAYAFMDLSNPAKFPVFSLEAIQCNVPVIAADKPIPLEICGDATLYVNNDDNKDIGEKMMLIFKDEKLRQQLIENGQEQIKKYSIDKTANAFWESIEKACM